MRVGVGYEDSTDAYASGRAVAKMAIDTGGIKKPSFIFAFCHGSLNHSDFYDGLRSVVGNEAPIFGGSSMGVISNDYLCYEGCPAGAAIVSSGDISCKWAYSDQLYHDESVAGKRIGIGMPKHPDDFLFLIFYDSIKIPPTTNTPPVMNASPPLIEAIEKNLQSKVPIIGAGVLGGADFGPTQQFCGDHVGSQEAVGIMLSGKYSAYHCVMHGCVLQDGVYHTITRMDGAKLFELDDQPIVPIIDEIYGGKDWREQRPLKRLAIGVNYGDLYGPYKEDCYVNRLITGVLPNNEGILLFEPDLKAGTKIQFMLRNSHEMILSTRSNTEKLVSRILNDGKQPVYATYINCGGRAAALSDTMTEEASELVEIMNQHKIPLFGFYTGVEIAPMLGRSRGLDWTGVLTILAR